MLLVSISIQFINSLPLITEISLLAMSSPKFTLQTSYHVVLFDCKEPTRAWLELNAIKKFVGNEHLKESSGIYEARLHYAFERAQIATSLPLLLRLETYSFISRCPNKIKELEQINPSCKRKTTSVTDLEKFGKKNTKKRKYYMKGVKYSTE